MKTRLLLVLVLLLPTGCTPFGIPKGPKNLFQRIVTLDFRKTPAEKFEQAVAGDEVAQDALLNVGHEGAVLTQAAIVQIPGESPEKARAQGFANDTVEALDAALGIVTPKRKAELLLMLERLKSADPKVSFLGEGDLAKWRTTFFEVAAVKREWEAERSAHAAASAEWGKERDAVAKKWEGLWFWIWVGLGLYIFIAWIMPVLSKAFPALRGVSMIAQGIIAPGVTMAYKKTREVLGDVVGGVNELRKDVLANIPEIKTEDGKVINVKEKADAVLSQWVTEADGTAAAVDAIRREKGFV